MLEKMSDFFENRLDGYDEHMYTAIEGADKFYLFTASQLPMAEQCHVLDLGCGTGLELEPYINMNPTAAITGIDLCQAMLDKLKQKFPKNGNLNLICGSYFDVPLGTDSFDAVVSVESLHHFTAEQKLPLYKKLHRSMKKDAYFVLTDYFAESEALEKEYFENLDSLKREQGIADDEFYHYDTPLTVEHETQILTTSGFSRVEILRNWGATYCIKAFK